MQSPSAGAPPPNATAPGASTWKSDIVSGFLVFLIALPLCLGISLASGFPPVAGILTAVVGGMVSTWVGSARLTIKGPAAGLIVIALGAVTELGNGDPQLGYRRALATIVVGAVIQIIFALLRTGSLGDFFPSSVVHGMLAAIGIIICSKQIHVLMGVTPASKTPLTLLAEIPHSVMSLNPEIAFIGVASLIILFGHQALAKRYAPLKRVPGPLIALLFAVPMGLYFDLDHEHTFTFSHDVFSVGPKFLVNLPNKFLSAITLPDFSDLLSSTSIKYIVMFSLVGSIETLLTTKAMDMMDPEKRRADLDKDLFATGLGNLIAGMLGGLPMISEVVRSSANINYGAKSRLSNFFHGTFLLLFVALVPMLIHRIPLAALAAMLIFAGVRLASPKEFVNTFRIGAEQFVIFTFTVGVTLATDLLMGVIAGIVLKMVVHLINGATPASLFKPSIEETKPQPGQVVLRVSDTAVFTNYLRLKKLLSLHPDAQHIEVDLTDTRLVDHTTLERLHEMEGEFTRQGRHLHVKGLEKHRALSAHPLSTRKKFPKGPLGAAS